MSRIRVVIADDEPLARGYLRSLLQSQPDCEIVAECPDAASTVTAILNHEPDIVFLDVQMPGRDGFSVIQSIGADEMPHVIFVTAHDRYAIPAFDTHALDYLLKPFSKERFQEALARAREHLRLQRDAAWSHKLRGVLQTALGGVHGEGSEPGPARDERGKLERIPVRIGGKVRLIKVGEIDWIEAADSYVILHCGRETFLHRESMNALDTALDPVRFCRIHRSSIVNIESVKEIQSDPSGDHRVVLKDGTSLTLSRRRRGALDSLLGRR